jgi:hypothetical protein
MRWNFRRPDAAVTANDVLILRPFLSGTFGR